MSFRNCNDTISTQCEFELNLLENEHYSHIDKDLSTIPNIMNSSEHIEIENLTYSPENDGGCLILYCTYLL